MVAGQRAGLVGQLHRPVPGKRRARAAGVEMPDTRRPARLIALPSQIVRSATVPSARGSHVLRCRPGAAPASARACAVRARRATTAKRILAGRADTARRACPARRQAAAWSRISLFRCALIMCVSSGCIALSLTARPAAGRQPTVWPVHSDDEPGPPTWTTAKPNRGGPGRARRSRRVPRIGPKRATGPRCRREAHGRWRVAIHAADGAPRCRR